MMKSLSFSSSVAIGFMVAGLSPCIYARTTIDVLVENYAFALCEAQTVGKEKSASIFIKKSLNDGLTKDEIVRFVKEREKYNNMIVDFIGRHGGCSGLIQYGPN